MEKSSSLYKRTVSLKLRKVILVFDPQTTVPSELEGTKTRGGDELDPSNVAKFADVQTLEVVARTDS
ncbi:unnamed protein product [Linum trigynum]|uniref:Uncharacterized protein n=1 Tax=Linum trigynum TaxID=586398 RepID=A0AAV2FU80_9ROSI